MRGRNENRSLLLIIDSFVQRISGSSFPKIRQERLSRDIFLAENRDEYSGRANVPWMFLRRLHISGQVISRGADFNDQSHDIVAAAHKNMSLGCRNISVVETY